MKKAFRRGFVRRSKGVVCFGSLISVLAFGGSGFERRVGRVVDWLGEYGMVSISSALAPSFHSDGTYSKYVRYLRLHRPDMLTA